jgi:hypothetical protein
MATDLSELVADDAFLLGVNIPVVIPSRSSRTRTFENQVRRRLGFRLPPGGRAAADRSTINGEAMLAALAASGQPCLPYPDRDRRKSGLAEIHAGLVLKALLWENALAARSSSHPGREEIFKAYSAPAYRAGEGRGRASWANRAVAIDLALRSLGKAEGFDLGPVKESLASAASDEEVDLAASLFDATLIAGTARRYFNSPAGCAFLGTEDGGYTILPADGFIRKLALREGAPRTEELFPKDSLRKRLEAVADLRPLGLIDMPGKPQQVEATFHDAPLYEFDNVDEMLWWKHCRHLSGPVIPTEGLVELKVHLGSAPETGQDDPSLLKLARSRHSALSFRFDPPPVWRRRLPTRDGKTYPFKIVRATFDTLSGS